MALRKAAAARIRLTVLGLVFIALAVFFFRNASNADTSPIRLASLYKDIPTGFSEEVQPNVLLLLDTSGSMTFRLDRNTSTYGDGTATFDGQQYYGNDVDSSNNDPTGRYNYHPNLLYIPTAQLPSSSQRSYLGGSHANDDPPEGYSSYKYPNDSRMYQLKLVLYDILNSPNLVSGLRIAMSTYWQSNDRVQSEWYTWPPTSDYNESWSYYYGYRYRQNISWDYSTNRNCATLREDFESTDDSTHLSDLIKWVDGMESSSNPELRANGHTPLAPSIYNTTSATDCALDYFKKSGTINAWCQDNWLIVLTDGQDTSKPAVQDPAAAVRNLYATGYTSTSWPSFFSKRARPVRTFVIGLIASEDLASTASTLNDMADYGDDGEKNGSAAAYFVTDVESLMNAFEEIFRTIQSVSGTGGAPLISPSRVEGESTSLYVSKFIPKKERQWEGQLEKFSVTDSGTSSTADWEAGDKLDKRAYSRRNIYTVNWLGAAGAMLTGSNLVYLNESNASSLRAEMTNNVVSESLFSKFVRWFLGSDEWDEATGRTERWKLSDIYHSGMTEVGPPQGRSPSEDYRAFTRAHQSRARILYTQSNDGILHAFNNSDGEERWGFVPPNVSAFLRLVGLKGRYVPRSGNDSDQRYGFSDTATTYPRYLLDGPVVAEDVRIAIPGADSAEWHTILMGLLGYAGTGFYAMDITNPDQPRFLWAVENAILRPQSDPENGERLLANTNRQVQYWLGTNSPSLTAIAHSDVTGETDYRKMLFTLSVPAIGAMKIDGTYKWVAVMGNGTNRGLFQQNEGCVYLINLETGKILKTLTTSNMKNVVTPVTVLKTNNDQRIEKFYAGEDNGWVYEWNQADWDTARRIINLNGSSGPSYRMEVASFNGTPWLFIATGDFDPLVSSSSNNYLVGLNTRYAPYNNLSQFTEIDPEDSDGLSSSAMGWYIVLGNKELPTTPPKLYNGFLFFSTFAPDTDPCKTGVSKIYLLNARTGYGGWGSGKKVVSLGGVKISGITISGGKAILGATDFSSGNFTLPSEMNNARLRDNMLFFDVPSEVENNEGLIPSGQMIPLYWREWRP